MHLTVQRFISLLDPEIIGQIVKTTLISFANFIFASVTEEISIQWIAELAVGVWCQEARKPSVLIATSF